MKKERMPITRGGRKTKYLLKNHPINHLISNIHWDVFEQILEITKSTPTQFLAWIESLSHVFSNPCLSYNYLDRFLFFSHPVDNVQFSSLHRRHIQVPEDFIGIGITIDDTWDLYQSNEEFRTAVTKKYKEKYGL